MGAKCVLPVVEVLLRVDGETVAAVEWLEVLPGVLVGNFYLDPGVESDLVTSAFQEAASISRGTHTLSPTSEIFEQESDGESEDPPF